MLYDKYSVFRESYLFTDLLTCSFNSVRVITSSLRKFLLCKNTKIFFDLYILLIILANNDR